MKNYGIFKANHEYSVKVNDIESSRLSEDSLWDVVDSDENIDSPIEIFDTLDAAKEALSKYSSSESISSSRASGYKLLDYEVYFIAELELYNEDEPDKKSSYVNGDGLEVAKLV